MFDKLENGHGDVLLGHFPAHGDDRPRWVQDAMKKHPGLTFRVVSGGHYFLEGTAPELPSRPHVDSELGYLRTTGQWRYDVALDDYDVEVFCCKSLKTDWLPVKLLTGVRFIDYLE